MTETRERIPPSVSAVVGEQVKAVREQMNLTQVDLVGRMRLLGLPLSQAALTRIETGKRRLSVDEVLALAVALGVNPIHLVCASFKPQTVQVTPEHSAGPETMLQWFRGQAPLEGMDEESYFSMIPENERILERRYGIQNLQRCVTDFWEAAAEQPPDWRGMDFAMKALRREIDRQQDQLVREERKAKKESTDA